jgi:hypothetical protein
MKIEWKFDDEKEWDPFTLLGTIKLIDEFGNFIEDRITILDSWFIAINKGLASLADGINLDVDLIDEPDPLLFISKDDKLSIRYKNQKVYLRNVSDAIESLRLAVTKFVEILMEYPEPRDETAIVELGKIIKN